MTAHKSKGLEFDTVYITGAIDTTWGERVRTRSSMIGYPENLPLASGDPGRITQCLMNLAGNALKFTREGRVEISVELQGDLLVYRVADTGIGIARDTIETVFAEFRQGDATITSEFGGTGLGLSITKKFVEMHRGRIWVESELGKGSTFLFAIPLRLDRGRTS